MPPPRASLLGRLGIAEQDLEAEDLIRLDAVLGDATALVLAEVPVEVARRWTELSAPHAIHTITLKAARREFQNPDGVSTETVVSHTLSLSNSSGVYLTRREIQLIRNIATGSRGSRFWSLRTPSTREGDTSEDGVELLQTSDLYLTPYNECDVIGCPCSYF